MKSSLLSVVAIASSLSMAPSVLAQTSVPAPTGTMFQSYSDFISLSSYTYGQGSIEVWANSYDNQKGAPDGYVSLNYYSPGNLGTISIRCYGPVVANLISVTPGGVATLKGTLSGNTPGCTAYSSGNISDTASVTLNLSGNPDNSYSAVGDGISRNNFYGIMSIQKIKAYSFAQSYSGTISVDPNFIFSISGSGFATATRAVSSN